MLPWLLIPMRSIRTGKSRLRPHVDETSRRRINEALLARVLVAAGRFPGIGRTAVISQCDETLSQAARAGALPLRQSEGVAGLCQALTEGVTVLRAGGAVPILVAVADLPFVEGQDLLEIAALGLRTGDVVICADKHGTGTNSIYLPKGVTIPFRFGPHSCTEHMRASLQAGMSARIHFNSRVACDLDTPEDLCLYSRAPLQSGSLRLDSHTNEGAEALLAERSLISSLAPDNGSLGPIPGCAPAAVDRQGLPGNECGLVRT